MLARNRRLFTTAATLEDKRVWVKFDGYRDPCESTGSITSIKNRQVEQLVDRLFRLALFEYSVTQDSKQRALAEQVVIVRTLAQAQLTRFAKLEPADCKEVYLFQHDQFCGVRFNLGAFHADWRINESVLNLFRGDRQIDRIEIKTAITSRAA